MGSLLAGAGALKAISAIAAIFGPILMALLTIFTRARDQHTGAVMQSAAADAATARVQAAVANAVVNAPRTQAGVVASLQGGAF